MNDISTIPYSMRSNVKLSIHNLHAHLPRYSFTVILEQFLLLSLFFVVQTPGKIEMNCFVSYRIKRRKFKAKNGEPNGKQVAVETIENNDRIAQKI